MLRLFVAMAIGHVVILGARLCLARVRHALGAEKAWLVGVVPFLAASLIKNALGAACCRRFGGCSTAARLIAAA